MNIKEFKDEFKELGFTFAKSDNEVDLYAKIRRLIDQLDEPEKPVVPQFVANWIEKCKANKHTLYGVFQYATGEVEKWIFESGSKADKADLVGRAWLDGYEVEKSEYIVKLGKAFVRADSKISINREKAHIYKNKAYAERRAEELGGKVEEVSK